MADGQVKTWLIAYDIGDPRRLKRIHRQMKRKGVPLQYSAFSVRANSFQLGELLNELQETIDTSADDIRAYHVPDRCLIWQLGQQGLPDGIAVDSVTAAALLLCWQRTHTEPDEQRRQALTPEGWLRS